MVATIRLINCGVLDDLPDLRVQFSHEVHLACHGRLPVKRVAPRATCLADPPRISMKVIVLTAENFDIASLIQAFLDSRADTVMRRAGRQASSMRWPDTG